MISNALKTNNKCATKRYKSQPRLVEVKNVSNKKPKRLIKSISFSIIFCITFFVYLKTNYNLTTKSESHEISNTPLEYFIYTSQCQIPFVNPFTPEILEIFKPKAYKYTNCTNDEAFITTIYRSDICQHILLLNMNAIGHAARRVNVKANAKDVRCCYRRIKRGKRNDKLVDSHIKISSCITFNQNFSVPRYINYILTECYLENPNRQLLQQDAFSFIQNRLNDKITTIAKRKPSVLLIGFDSMSRINLRRVMPKTFRYLQMQRWFELQGYNKVGYNTFPNLMPLLTSYNNTMAINKCQPETLGGLNKRECNFIWNNFRRNGYRTAYAEDSWQMATFNYFMKGFRRPPTDDYLRPMMIAIEQNMTVQKKYEQSYCVGRKHYAEYVFDYAIQFAQVYGGYPVFGLFWMNSFSHATFTLPAEMDAKVLEYLRKMHTEGILDDAIVFLLSDHGMRWGPLISLPEGFLEERLPFMFTSLPEWFKNAYPEFVKALKINQNRLTTPYDIYATLRHILKIAAPKSIFPFANDTIQGVSVFGEIPENRTCIDANIPDQWCTCLKYRLVSCTDDIVKNISDFILVEMNRYIKQNNWNVNCSDLELNKISKAFRRVKENENDLSADFIYRISFTVNPNGANFDAMAQYNTVTGGVRVKIEDIIRSDSYSNTSKCVNYIDAKKYCICRY